MNIADVFRGMRQRWRSAVVSLYLRAPLPGRVSLVRAATLAEQRYSATGVAREILKDVVLPGSTLRNYFANAITQPLGMQWTGFGTMVRVCVRGRGRDGKIYQTQPGEIRYSIVDDGRKLQWHAISAGGGYEPLHDLTIRRKDFRLYIRGADRTFGILRTSRLLGAKRAAESLRARVMKTWHRLVTYLDPPPPPPPSPPVVPVPPVDHEVYGGFVSSNVERVLLADIFALDPKIIPVGKSYEWKRLSIMGVPDDGHMADLREQHWKPVPARRHPSLPAVKGKIIHQGMMLMERPRYLTQDALREGFENAQHQVGYVQGAAEVRRSYGLGALVGEPMSPIVPAEPIQPKKAKSKPKKPAARRAEKPLRPGKSKRKAPKK